jgi:hypothetical protein
MKQGRIFLVVLGIFYLLNLAMTQPFAAPALFHAMYPGIAPVEGSVDFKLLSDAWLIVGIQLAAIGVVALCGARNPLRYLAVFDVVVATEILDAAWDFYSITWSHEVVAVGVTTLIIHAIVISWALYAKRSVLAAGG